MTWAPATEADERAMLETIGVKSVDDLFSTIPDEVRLIDSNPLILRKGPLSCHYSD